MRLTILLALTLTLVLPRSSMAQSFTWCQSGGPNRNFWIVSYDAEFLFASRHHGSARDSGNTEPGFFVHSRSHNRWIRILAVTTRDGRFGRSYSSDSLENARLGMVSVMWDFTALAREQFASIPLHTPGTIELPDSIVHEPATERYALHFMSSWRDIPTATTTLYITRADLRAAFASPEAVPARWCPTP